MYFGCAMLTLKSFLFTIYEGNIKDKLIGKITFDLTYHICLVYLFSIINTMRYKRYIKESVINAVSLLIFVS